MKLNASLLIVAWVMAMNAMAAAQVTGPIGGGSGGTATSIVGALTGCSVAGDVLYSASLPGTVGCATGFATAAITSVTKSNAPSTANDSIVMTSPVTGGLFTVQNTGNSTQTGLAGFHMRVGSDGSHQMYTNGSFVFPAVYSSATTYAQGAIVSCAAPGCASPDNLFYTSKVNGNLNHNPSTDGGTNWVTYNSPSSQLFTLAYDDPTLGINGLEFGQAGFQIWVAPATSIGGEAHAYTQALEASDTVLSLHVPISADSITLARPAGIGYVWKAYAVDTSGHGVLGAISDTTSAQLGTFNNFPLSFFTNNGATILTISTAGTVQVPNGTTANPSLGPLSVPTSGFSWPAANQMAISIAGTNKLDFGINYAGASPPATGGWTYTSEITQYIGGPAVIASTAADGFYLNSTGANYGKLQNVNADTWMIGYGATIHTLGTAVISWTDNAAVTIAPNNGILAVTGRITVSAFTAASGTDILCYNTSGGAITYATTVVGCVPSAERFKDMLPSMTTADAVNLVKSLGEVKRWIFKPEANLGDDEFVGWTADQIERIDSRFVAYDDDHLLYGIKHQQLAEAAISGLSVIAKRHEDDIVTLRSEFDAYRRAHP